MITETRSSTAPPHARRCVKGCGRRATVVSGLREYCSACYSLRRSRVAAKAASRRD